VDAVDLRRQYRDHFLAGLTRLRERGELQLQGDFAYLEADEAWQSLLLKLESTEWVSYIQPPPIQADGQPCSAEHVLKYLARYLTGGPISEGRIIAADQDEVTFWAREGKTPGGDNQRVPIRLPTIEFTRRWCLHILPKGYRDELNPYLLEFEMAYSMKSDFGIQEVKILPRVAASHRPSSETRWQEETNVRSRVNQVDRLCIELRNGYLRGPNLRLRMERGRNAARTPESVRRETRTALARWNARSKTTLMASRCGGHRSRRPGHVDQGMSRELVRASSSPVRRNRGSSAEPSSAGVHRDTKAPSGKASTARSIQVVKNAENTGTTQRAGWRRRVGWTLGSLS